MVSDIYLIIAGTEDAIVHAGLAALAVPFVLLAVVWLVLKLDENGWLP